MTKCLIVGGSRGIGLALCNQAVEKGFTTFVTCRKVTPELASLQGDNKITVIDNVDVTDSASLERVTEIVKDCEYVIHNSGIAHWESNGKVVGELSEKVFKDMRDEYEVNGLAPLRMLDALVRNSVLKRGGKFGVITSRMGSIADGSGKYYGYRGSKAYLNMTMNMAAKDLASSGVAVGILHPGMVATDMTAAFGGGISAEESANGIWDKMQNVLNTSNTGTFWHACTGEIIPW
mmetsp:Transcript_20365/g.24719  ORF Transcript_20365/g.24719 Transcript_20365/m.24719 type:complete len:234 (-) Transcript_20365:145-846(-)|eukprot:CAMPEP_0204835898 /NCGR_PEP_ID=MMETSP1346-20131115/23956_1 /ASSEMBLY_ACC=CAM_ASM_000771 /TAXON_ID=215587 /ORGANISM="Aplanochytrium stocchinoi, Strain GSBS06" /LENGTH=233 /DNA_ID=CAMNT_0051970295 /DNA_START=18 /DNA_END=719 /DNA_ORIENTATION=-